MAQFAFAAAMLYEIVRHVEPKVAIHFGLADGKTRANNMAEVQEEILLHANLLLLLVLKRGV